MKNQFLTWDQIYHRTYLDMTGAILENSDTMIAAGWLQLLPRTGIVKGDFKRPNPWSYRREERHYARGSIHARAREGLLYWNGSSYVQRLDSDQLSGNLGQAFSPYIDYDASGDQDAAYNGALGRLNDSIRGSLDLSVDAFQIKQNRDMLSASNRLESFVRRTPLVKRIGSAWLELQYGWKPLVSDLYGVIDETVRVELNKERTFRGSANIPYRQVIRLPGHAGLGTRTHTITGTACSRIGVTLKVDSDFDLARWSSLNPVSIAWELLPYSFVVDWVYDVGGSLRALETAMAYQQRFVSGYVDDLLFGDEVCTNIAPDSAYGSDYIVDFYFNWNRKVTDFNRNVLGGYPFPRPPVFKGPLSSGHLMNLAGLLSQFLGRH